MRAHNFKLQQEDRETLEKLLSQESLPTRVYKRALGLLELDRGRRYVEVTKTLGRSVSTLHKWSTLYKRTGLSFLQDAPRSGRPPVLSGELKAKVTALACSAPPEGYGSWSLRLLADKVVELGYCETISHTEVGRILKKTSYSPTARSNGASRG